MCFAYGTPVNQNVGQSAANNLIVRAPISGVLSFRTDRAFADSAIPPVLGAPLAAQSRSLADEYLYFYNQEEDSVNQVPVAMLVGAMLAISTFYANAANVQATTDADDHSAITLAADASQKICGDVRFDGDDVRGELKLQAKAALPGLLKRWGLGSADASGSLNTSGSAYRGPSRADLPAVIKSTQDCRSEMARYILNLMYSSRGKSGPSQRAVSNATAIAKTGDVLQQQSQNVFVNNAQVKIPSFTITQQPMSMSPTFHVVPDSPGQVDGGPQPLTNDPIPLNVSAAAINSSPSQSRIADSGSHSIELILGHRRKLWNGASITFIGRALVNGHWQVALESKELWDYDNRVSLPTGVGHEYSSLIPEDGEAMYVEAPDGEYNLTAGDARQPPDGSPLRVTIRFTK
ncbi:hypothetical protein R69888_00073 [Paraburkholderia haematera]|uniref:Uncharacterized protein n=2 Tax=Paraburkholderia haematera TaxID=2793077 RepID=A0ABN7KDX6_9BURK|nr:hypothetical protein R69888_00073 [Paraburkholderia haematera]